jgi:hypothetical protein
MAGMANHDRLRDVYIGFEQGPIRPPSEAQSLLIRVTRNCPWNRCTFCPVYKSTKFSIRPVDHVLKDIDLVHRHVEALLALADDAGQIDRAEVSKLSHSIEEHERMAFFAAIKWMAGGMRSVFLQDANSLVIKPPELVRILEHLTARFPNVERITSYARSQTVARMTDDDLRAVGRAGLNRIHIGMESGSDDVLKMVKKGVTKAQHVAAGLKVKRAGIQLSEYVMPGLGGRALSDVHAAESADAVNQIDPDFIRLRSLAIPTSVPLYEAWASGEFEKCSDLMVAEETLRFIERLDGITSTVKSDHVLNLFEDLEGTLPQDKERMVEMIRAFVAMDPQRQCEYQVGRRLGVFRGLADMADPDALAQAQATCKQYNITPQNADTVINELMARFI